jgi:NitT/TauT family transport system substrate-binding protein
VKIEMMAASVANQALVAGSIDIYNGAASMITAHLAGADSIYIAAPSDHPQIVLLGRKGVNSLADLKGKTIAITSAGTSKDIFARYSASKAGLTVDKDIKLLYNPSEQALMATFTNGNADAALVSPPFTTQLAQQGYPVLEDYGKEGLKIIEPGVVVSKAMVDKMPNTLKAYLMGYLDGTKRALEDAPYTKQIDTKTTKVDDQSVIDFDYELGLKTWNKDLTVDPADIQLVLDSTTDPKAKTAKAAEFFDNSLITAVNRDYATKVFPGDIKS